MGSLRTRVLRGGVIGAVCALVVPFGSRVDAADAAIQPNPTGYYTKTQDPFRTIGGEIGDVVCQVPSPDPRTCLDPAQVTGGTPGYPRRDNYIYVASINGDDDSRGVIGVPLFVLPPGSTINSLVLDFFVENEGAAGTLNFDPDDPALMLCLVTAGWAGQDAAPYDSQPDTDCSVQSEPTKVKEEERSEETDEGVPQEVSLVGYSADLMPMAAKWAGGAPNEGVMIRPAAEAPIAYQVAVRTPAIAQDGMTLRVSYTPGQTAAPPAPAVPDTPPAAAAPTFGEPPEPEEVPFEVAEPDVAPEQVLAAPEPVSSSTPWWTFLGLPIGLALLAGLGRGVTEPMTSPTAERAGPVSRLMDRGKDR